MPITEPQTIAWISANWQTLASNWPSLLGSLLLFLGFVRLNRFLNRISTIEAEQERSKKAQKLMLSKCKQISKEEMQEVMEETTKK